MSPDDRMERLLTELLAEDQPSRPPDRLVPETLRTLRRTRRWPRWFALMKEPPMRYPNRVVAGSPPLRLLTIAALSLVLLLATMGAIAAGASVLSADNAPPPFGPAKNGNIAFARDGDVYLADADGGNERAIVSGPAMDVSPWFSHDGRTIAFARETGPDSAALMVAEADGSNAREVLGSMEWAEFTPSDSEMVASRMVDGQLVMSVIDLDTGATRDLDLQGIEPFWWAYSRPPDGDEIIFVGYPSPGEPATGIYAINMDGTGLRAVGEISTDESPRTAMSPRRWSFQDPSLSPDGRTIAFWNFEPAEGTDEVGGYVRSLPYLHLRDLATGEELPVPFDAGDGTGYMPRFLPDGTGILFQGNVTPEGGAPSIQLFHGQLDGSQAAVPIGPSFRYPNELSWNVSPDGTQVLLTVQTPSQTSIIDVASGESTGIGDLGDAWDWQRLAP